MFAGGQIIRGNDWLDKAQTEMSVLIRPFFYGGIMQILSGNIKKLYLKFLFASLGSAMITSIYSIVDMAMVGQYYGPIGTTTLATIAPIWNIIFGFGLLMGIGGASLFSNLRGQGNERKENENVYFTSAIIGSVVLAFISWMTLILAQEELLMFFGADKEMVELGKKYLLPICFVFPLFLFNQMLSVFIKNDNNPVLATVGILSGGIFNIVGDYVFVFAFDMGIFGAGLATALGAVVSFITLLIHFFTKKNTLRIIKVKNILAKQIDIVKTGFSTFIVDIAMGVITILFNRQIMKYLGADQLAVYGPIINISTVVQCCAYSIGQAGQPIISLNYGAKQYDRISKTFRYSIITCAIFGVFWTTLSLAVPNLYTYIFMQPTENILNIAPSIIRKYSISFLLLPLNIFSTYYFQSLLKPKYAFAVSILRSLVISGSMIMLLPIVFGADYIWYAMAITELLVAVLAIYLINICNHNLKLQKQK